MALIKVTGVGVDTQVDVPDGANIEVVLNEAGIDDAESVNIEVNGESVTPDTPVEAGSSVVATPRAAALG